MSIMRWHHNSPIVGLFFFYVEVAYKYCIAVDTFRKKAFSVYQIISLFMHIV